MTRQRLRPAYSPAELADLYREPYDHSFGLWAAS